MCDTTVIYINVPPRNDPPVGVPDTVIVPEDSSLCIAVLGNDSDPDGDTISVGSIVTAPANGAAIISGDSICYTPDPDYDGPDTLYYSLCDNGTPGMCDTTVVYINVPPVNDPPVAVNDTVIVPKDSSLCIPVTDNDSDPENSPLAVTMIVGPDSGAAVLSNDSICYTPNPGFEGRDTLTYSICDTNTPSLCDTAFVYINVPPENDPPVGVPDTLNVPEDSTLCIAVLDNDSDPEGPVTIGGMSSLPTNGTASISGDSICYTPDPDFFGPDTLYYVVCDTGLPILCDTVMVIINVNPVNDPPVAINDTVSTPEDVAVDITVLINDSDIEGPLDSTSVVIITSPNDGTTNIDPITGEVTYDPDTNFMGIDSFEYVVCDTGNPVLCDTAWVFINIGPINDPPIGVTDTVSIPEDSTLCIAVLANDSDPDGGPLSTDSILILPTNGTASISGDSICYTPDPDFNGPDTLYYVVCDTGNPVLCDTVLVIINVDPVNDPPIAVNDTVNTNEDTPIDIVVLINDSDIEGPLDSTSVVIITSPNDGTTSIDPITGEVTYDPDTNFVGIDSFEYVVCDTGNPVLCDTAWVFINVGPINDPPIAVNDTVNTNEDTPIDIVVLINDSDVEGPLDSTSVVVITPPNDGSTIVDPVTGEVTYDPDTNFVGVDSFQYVVCDTGSPVLCDTAWVFINVSPVNDPPVAIDDTVSTPEDTPIDIVVLINDSDIEGPLDSTSVVIITPANNGSTIVDPITGEVTYTPDPGFVGVDSFEYVVCDTGNPVLCDTAWVYINVSPVNDPPVAVNDTVSTPEDTPIDIVVLINDSDIEGPLDSTSVVIITPANNGSTIVDPITGEVTYTPDPGFVGVDSFEYVVCDTGNPVLCDTAWVYINVSPVNDPPVAVNDTVSTPEDTPIDIVVLINDSDIEGPLDSTSVVIITPANNGSTIVDPITGEVTYTPDPGFVGVDSFEYVVCDTGNPVLCDTAWVYINVSPVNDPPVAVNDTVSTPEDTPIDIVVLINDSDIEGPLDSTSVMVITPPNDGSTSVDPVTGEVTYTPDPNFFGVDSFEYVVCDTGSPVLCDTAWVYINVSPVNDPPFAVNDTFNTNEDTPVDITILGNDYDIEGPLDSSSVVIITPANNGSTIVDPVTGEVTYTPNTGFVGVDSFEYVVCDTGDPVLCDTAWVYIEVHPVNHPPVAQNDSVTTDENTSVSIDILGNDSDPDGNLDTSSVVIITTPDNGSATVQADGSVTYIPDAGFFGVDSFQYVLCDLGMPIYCDTAWVYITVDEVVDEQDKPVNGFSPNGDGVNDGWYVKEAEEFPVNELVIFNRWGDDVWRTKDYHNLSNFFSGHNMEGENLADGTYYYILTIYDGDKILTKTGWVFIYR